VITMVNFRLSAARRRLHAAMVLGQGRRTAATYATSQPLPASWLTGMHEPKDGIVAWRLQTAPVAAVLGDLGWPHPRS